MSVNRATKILGIVIILLAISIFMQACTTVKGKSSDSNDFQVVFKLDARLLGPTYSGERWVPPPYGPIAYAGSYSLEARTYRLDSSGQEYALQAEWIPDDPEMVTISQEATGRVTITVHKLGETSLVIKTAHGKTKTLHIKASAQNSTIKLVEISQ